MSKTKLNPRTRTYIVANLRKIWKWSSERTEVRKRARISRGSYKCEQCGRITDKLDVDHIVPVGVSPGSKNDAEGRTWDDYIAALFCDVSNLQGLCLNCHKAKTKSK